MIIVAKPHIYREIMTPEKELKKGHLHFLVERVPGTDKGRIIGFGKNPMKKRNRDQIGFTYGEMRQFKIVEEGKE